MVPRESFVYSFRTTRSRDQRSRRFCARRPAKKPSIGPSAQGGLELTNPNETKSSLVRLADAPLGRGLRRLIDENWHTHVEAHYRSQTSGGDQAVTPDARIWRRIAALRALARDGGWLVTDEAVFTRRPSWLANAPSTLTFASGSASEIHTAVVGCPPNCSQLGSVLDLGAQYLQRIAPVCRSNLGIHALNAAVRDFVEEKIKDAPSEIEFVAASSWHWRSPRAFGLPDDAKRGSATVHLVPLQAFDQYDETHQLLCYSERHILKSRTLLAGIISEGRGRAYGQESAADHRGAISPAHLGGHKHRSNIDLGSLAELRKLRTVRSMLDLGCGPAGMVFAAAQLGIDADGIDGDPALSYGEQIYRHDFTRGPLSAGKMYDLVWCIEFLEHLEERFLPNLTGTIDSAPVIFTTLAPPGQPGHHHVNCQPVEYWVKFFDSIGYSLNRSLTSSVRSASTMRSNFVRDNGFVWERK